MTINPLLAPAGRLAALPEEINVILSRQYAIMADEKRTLYGEKGPFAPWTVVLSLPMLFPSGHPRARDYVETEIMADKTHKPMLDFLKGGAWFGVCGTDFFTLTTGDVLYIGYHA